MLKTFNKIKYVKINSFVRETWNMRCASGKTCVTSSNRPESFIVTSHVTFTKIPASTKEQFSKFDLFSLIGHISFHKYIAYVCSNNSTL